MIKSKCLLSVLTALTLALPIVAIADTQPSVNGGGESDKGTLSFDAIPDKIFANDVAKVSLVATLVDENNIPVSGKNINFKVDGQSVANIPTGNNGPGKAVYDWPSGPFGATSDHVDPHTAQATVTEDQGDFSPYTDTDTFEVVAGGLKLTKSGTPVCEGDPVGLTATLKSGASGVQVSFSAQPGQWQATAPTDSSGVATIPPDDANAFAPQAENNTVMAQANGESDDVVITGFKVEIATSPKKICKGEESFTVNLTEDSVTDGDVTWTGVDGTGNGDSFTFNPSQAGEGEYTIQASVGSCNDSVQLKITSWQCSDEDSHTLAVNPGVTAQDIKDLGDLDEFQLQYEKQTENIKQSIEGLIDNDEEDELEDEWNMLPDPKEAFEDWLDEQIASAKDFVVGKIDDAIESSQDNLSNKIDQFCTMSAAKINQKFSTNATVKATYKYDCSEFDPGDPGWSEPELQPLAVDKAKAFVIVGFTVNIALEPAGVGIGSLPIAAQGKVSFSAQLDGFHGSPSTWKPTVQHPGPVTSNAKLNAVYSISTSLSTDVLVNMAGGVAISGNLKFPDNPYEIKMTAEDNCDKVLPWTP